MKFIVATILLLTITGTAAYSQKSTGFDAYAGNNTQVRFFPNPASTSINFEFRNPVEKGTFLQVFSFLGRRVANISVNSNRITLNLTDYITGIYVFQVKDVNGRVLESNKFQVSK